MCGCRGSNRNIVRLAPNDITDAVMTLVLWGESAYVKTSYADRRGVVRWLGVDWYGVPYPLRVVAWILWRIRPRDLPGCGCVVALKGPAVRRRRRRHAHRAGATVSALRAS